MSGWLTDGVPLFPTASGLAQVSVDTQLVQGAQPQTAALNLAQLSAIVTMLSNHADKTTVAGSRYFTSMTLGVDTQINGIAALIGTTGGTDKWLAELYDADGNLLATSATAGATVGSAGAVQDFDFTAPYAAVAGTYFLAIQTNGTTAKLATYNMPVGLADGLLTGSATGTFGTGANITPPTNYTANLGPVVLPY